MSYAEAHFHALPLEEKFWCVYSNVHERLSWTSLSEKSLDGFVATIVRKSEEKNLGREMTKEEGRRLLSELKVFLDKKTSVCH